MKKIIITICAIFIAGFAHADTETINWYVDGDIYDTTTCTIGGDINLPTAPYKYGYTFQGWVGYTPIEYIESTGTQWIDTGIYANGGTIIEAKIAPGGNNGSYTCQVGSIGYSSVNPDYTRNMIGCSANLLSFQKGRTFSGETYLITDNTPLVLYMDTRGNNFAGKVNDVSLNVNPGSVMQILSSQSNTIKLGYSDYSQTVKPQKNYYLKLWDSNNTLVRDLIPVLDSNGVACMYDKVSHQFFYNAGTGDFIAGPAI